MYTGNPTTARKLSGTHLANLHTFLVAARWRNFSKAAEELCLTASAVSHRIGKLEDELAITLFYRQARGVRLTEDGERIFLIMQQTMDTLSVAIAERSATSIAGQLTLYVRPSIAQAWLVPRLADFSARYPDVQLDLRAGNDIIDHRTGTVDLLLSYSDGVFPGLVSTLLMAERLAPVCSPAYATKHGLAGQPAHLRHCTLLHDAAAWEHAAPDAEWQYWAATSGASHFLPERRLTFDRSDLCVSAAIHHAGIAIGREQLVRQHLLDGSLVLPFGDFIEANGQGYHLVHRPLDPMPRRLQALIDWLRHALTLPLT